MPINDLNKFTDPTLAPSQSRGVDPSIKTPGGTIFRTRLDDSAAAQATRFFGNVGSKLTSAGATVMSAIGMQAGAQALSSAAGTLGQVAQSGGTATTANLGNTTVQSLSGGLIQSGSPGGGAPGGGPGQVASSMSMGTPFGAGAAGGQRMSANQTAFGAGAAGLPGSDGGVGISGGGSTGIGVGVSGGVGGAMGGSSSPIGAAAGGGSQDQLLNATKQMQETQMSFNLQYLQLQSQMQAENRSYTAVSNIMKTKHDTVKNSISNVR
jgi:hypothetical protein